MSKIMVVAAAAAGYVLGSRAGREHYEIIKDQAPKLWRSPQVQQAASQATDLAKDAAEQVKDQAAASDSPREDTASSNGRHAADQSHTVQDPTWVSADSSGALG